MAKRSSKLTKKQLCCTNEPVEVVESNLTCWIYFWLRCAACDILRYQRVFSRSRVRRMFKPFVWDSMDAFFLVAIKQKIRNWYSTEVTPLLVVWPYFSELPHIEALDLKKKIWCNQKHFFLNLILNFQKAFWRIPILKNCDSSQTLSCWLKDQPVIFFLSRQKWASTKEWEHQEYICLFSFRPRFLLLKVTYFFVLQATKANSALTVSCSPVFALSLFTVKVPAAISCLPLLPVS